MPKTQAVLLRSCLKMGFTLESPCLVMEFRSPCLKDVLKDAVSVLVASACLWEVGEKQRAKFIAKGQSPSLFNIVWSIYKRKAAEFPSRPPGPLGQIVDCGLCHRNCLVTLVVLPFPPSRSPRGDTPRSGVCFVLPSCLEANSRQRRRNFRCRPGLRAHGVPIGV